MNGLAGVLLALGDAPGAQSLLEDAVKVSDGCSPRTTRSSFSSLTDLARVRSARGQHADAAALASEAIAGSERAKDVEGTASARLALGRALTGLARYPEAEPELLGAEKGSQTARPRSTQRPSGRWQRCTRSGTARTPARVTRRRPLRGRPRRARAERATCRVSGCWRCCGWSTPSPSCFGSTRADRARARARGGDVERRKLAKPPKC